jgi:hypothetical protein
MRAISFAVVGLAVALAFAPSHFTLVVPGLAAEASDPPQVSPVDDFDKAYVEAKHALSDLNAKIEQRSGEIQKLTASDTAGEEIAQLQALIAETLGNVADNGKVAELGQKALDFARGKQAQFEKDTKFAPEEREFLLNEWKRAADKMKKEVDLLAQSRSQLAESLLRVQTRADYIAELQTLKDAEQVLAVIHELAGEIQETSVKVRNLLETAAAPAPGA